MRVPSMRMSLGMVCEMTLSVLPLNMPGMMLCMSCLCHVSCTWLLGVDSIVVMSQMLQQSQGGVQFESQNVSIWWPQTSQILPTSLMTSAFMGGVPHRWMSVIISPPFSNFSQVFLMEVPLKNWPSRYLRIRWG